MYDTRQYDDGWQAYLADEPFNVDENPSWKAGWHAAQNNDIDAWLYQMIVVDAGQMLLEERAWTYYVRDTGEDNEESTS